jgi:hypothetical protein
MAKVQGNILYKIYYGFGLVYLGRTKQPLQDRIRGHLFQKPMHRNIDINLVTRLEYAEFPTEADMYLYEIYFINKLKPPLNVDDRARDDVTVTLPEIEFKEFTTHLWDNWKDELNNRMTDRERDMNKWRAFNQEISILRANHKAGQISREEFEERKDALTEEHREIEKRLFG